jgi:APA family basic amino acid/polyamine antiporter
MCFYVGPEKVLELGDESVTYAATRLLGSTFAKALTVFVLISVMGTVNGVVLGFIRLPYSPQ